MDHDIFGLFNRYWWLIFPIFGMTMGLLRMNQRHDQSNKVLDMLKSYADQGKEPPPELLVALRDTDRPERRCFTNLWIPVCLFTGLCAAFVFFGLNRAPGVPFFFVAIIMGSLALGFTMTLLARRKQDARTPPQ